MRTGSELLSQSIFTRRLSTFVVVAETLSFRQAAAMIGRSQPAVTAQIQQLEEFLGVSLFIRSTRQVRLTGAGAELLERSKKLLVETDRLVSDFRSHAMVSKGQVVVSFSPTVAFGLFPPTLKAFEQEYPNVRVLLREDLGPEMFAALQMATVDFGIGPYHNVPDTLEFQGIFEQDFFLILRKEHPLSIRGYARFSDLTSMDLLCSAIGSTARAVLDEAFKSNGLTFKPKYEALQYPSLFSMTAAGFGATVMPIVNADLLAAMNLKAIPVRGIRMSRTVGLITRKGEDLSPASTAFLRIVRLTVDLERVRLGLDQSG